MTPEEKQTEIERLRAMLRNREGKPGFAANVQAIKAEIARLEGIE